MNKNSSFRIKCKEYVMEAKEIPPDKIMSVIKAMIVGAAIITFIIRIPNIIQAVAPNGFM